MPSPTLETILNFRDCGGYAAQGGRRMRRGRLFRSAQFPLASDADLTALNAMGVSAIVDLRRPLEREHNPHRPWPAFRVVTHDGIDGVELPPHLIAFAEAGTSADAAADAMRHIYRGIPYDPMIVDLYRDFFSALEADEGVLVHCAAGKDRTGVAVALVHHLLGVGEDAMLENYLATNQSGWSKSVARDNLRLMFGRDGKTVSEDAIDTVLSVRRDYLDNAFEVMKEKSGSLDAYLEDVLRVTPKRRAAIVHTLTEEGL